MQLKVASDVELKILVATDIHLGHAENHIELGNDSYHGFEEVLTIAKKQQVDILLLGGDLFDEVNPTQKCIFKCLNLLKENIFGQRELSSIAVRGIVPNFGNQNLNISLPIFTIHGNHDYPSNDFGKISVCDLLHASNYVNYFGKHINLTDHQGHKTIVIKPLIFQKMGLITKVAIYGLGFIKDIKLHEMFQKKLVVFQQLEHKEETLCIFIFHQNRYKGKKGGVGPSFENCVHAEQLPKWMDLVIWAHQHEAIYKVQMEAGIPIFQPGSTVITSYIPVEVPKKQCAVISIKHNKKYEVTSILLEKSFRQLITSSYLIEQIVQKYGKDQKINFDQYFDNELSNIFTELDKLSLTKKPIIRIKIDYTGHDIIRLIRIQEKYKGLVANNNKIFSYTQKRITNKNTFTLEDEEVLDMIRNNTVPRNFGREIELSQEVLQKFVEQFASNKLYFFSIAQLKDMISDYSNIDCKSSLSDIKQTIGRELEKKCTEHKKQIINFHKNNEKQFNRLYEKLLKNTNDSQQRKTTQDFNPLDIKADIIRLKNQYQQKQKQVMSVFSVNQQKMGASQGQGETQVTSKSIKQISQLSGQGKSSKNTLFQYFGEGKESKESFRLTNSSDEEDCCQRAQKVQYRQNETRNRFERANQMMANRQKERKGKKKEDR